jgi:TetR/AcrR family transcriptional repressor of nem operon
MEKLTTRDQIIRSGTALIALQGYNATGIDAILKAAQVPRGSFYHYFKSKEDFGLAVIAHFAAGFEQRLATFLEDEEVAPLDRIRNYLEAGLTRIDQNACTRGCLLGNLGQELAGLNECFRVRLEEIFALWQLRLSRCLAEAQQRRDLSVKLDAQLLAGHILSGWEGAILRTKVMKSPQPMRDFIDLLFATALTRG